MEGKLGPKIQNLKNFLTDLNSEESQNYINDLISKETVRPEELFVGKFLNAEFWKEVGFSDKEIKIEGRAGVKGRVEIGLHIEDRKIAVECKKPYYLKNGEAVRSELDGNDIFELEDQISQYLLSHHFVIFTNGFHWFFYSQESYAIWQSNKNKKDNQINPYFDHFTEKEIFDQNSNYFIFNILSRQNILESLASMGNKSVRNAITDEFFIDLKNWAGFINFVLKDTPSNTKARTTSLINKFIFVRTMEGVVVIPNGFLASLWDNKKGVRNSPVDFIDHIDDELSEIYDTELFTPKFIVDEDGKDILKNELPQYSEERKKNYAYVVLCFLT